MLRQKIRNFRAMHHYFLADHFNKYVTPKLLCISHIQMTDKSAKLTFTYPSFTAILAYKSANY